MKDLPDDPLELDRQVCFALAVANRSVIGIYRPILEPLGLTHPQYLVMLALWGDAPLRFGELARMLRFDPASLSPIIKRLEQSGLIERVAVDGDERTFNLVPTEAGHALRLPRTYSTEEKMDRVEQCLIDVRELLISFFNEFKLVIAFIVLDS